MRKVTEIMTKDCVTVSPKDNIFEAAVLMRDKDIGFIPVVDGGKLLGVITDRDLVLRGYADKNSGSTSVMEVLTKDVHTVSPDTSVDEAADIMATHQIRRLPVVENGNLVGIVALGDMAIEEIFMNEASNALSEISEPEPQHTGMAH